MTLVFLYLVIRRLSSTYSYYNQNIQARRRTFYKKYNIRNRFHRFVNAVKCIAKKKKNYNNNNVFIYTPICAHGPPLETTPTLL